MNDIEQTDIEPDVPDAAELKAPGLSADYFYTIQFRHNEPILSASSQVGGLRAGEVVMIHTDHGLEPARIIGCLPLWERQEPQGQDAANLSLVRKAHREEEDKFSRLQEREKEAFELCRKQIEQQRMDMKLIKVERFFNGGKIIFYFTAENRVDFRDLVKSLVQEFRTRVEMRQVGVRHETKMIGGLGCCGRELCCSSFIRNFAPVSIKMAKEQNLPLNPVKISGICNRLLCCLTYEFSTYRTLKKDMPKPGKTITLDGKIFKVLHANVLQETITVVNPDDPENVIVLPRDKWPVAPRVGGKGSRKEGRKQSSGEDEE